MAATLQAHHEAASRGVALGVQALAPSCRSAQALNVPPFLLQSKCMMLPEAPWYFFQPTT